MPPVRFSGPCTPRDTGILFSEFLRPNSDEHLPRWPAKVVKQVVKVSPVCAGQKETFNQVTESRPVPHKNPLVVLLSTSVCRPSSHEITLQQLSTFTFTFAMPPPKWSTQLLSPSLSDDDDDDEASWVTTPMSGVYGLCFGHPDAPFESCCSLDEADGITASNNRKRKEQSSSSSSSNVPYCGGKCRAQISPPRNSSTGSSGDNSILLSLPLPNGKSEPIVAIDESSADGRAHSSDSIDAADVQQGAEKYTQTPTFLTSTMIGRAVFFPKDTRIRVEHCCGRAPCQPKWRLVLHRELFRSENAAEYAAVNLNPRENQTKHLICGGCGKKFPSIKGIKAHYLTAHVSNDESGSASIPSAIDEVPSILRRPLEVVYDDEAMAVVVKPQGVNVMGGRPSLLRSDLFMALRGSPSPKAVVEDSGNGNGIKRSPDLPLSKPVAVHRLDAPTGGLLLIAKTRTAEVELKECFRSRTCKKRYRAIVFGRLGGIHADEGTGVMPSGVIDVPVDKKEAVTKWQVVEYTPCSEPAAKGFITTVDLWPDTGRKHQLRKHMQALGCPIWGDKRYGPYNVAKEKTNETKRRKKEDEVHSDHVMLSIADGHNDLLESATVEQHPHCRLCLFALELAFPHPITKQETTVCINEPQWYQDIRQYCLRLTRAK